MEIILASQSPRRKEILDSFKLDFSTQTSNFDESKIKFKGSPSQFVIELAKEKGKVIYGKYPDSLIISADTTVHLNGKIYEKPKDFEEAFLFLKDLSGHTHEVYTGLCICHQGRILTDYGVTKVTFHQVDDKQIRHYAQKINSLDKAGGYAVQGAGALIVNKIEGCFFNVMGLPITPLANLLKKCGVDLWDTGKAL